MTTAKQFQVLILLSLAAAGCTGSTDETASAESNAGGKADEADTAPTAHFAAYDEMPRWCGETDGACLTALDAFAPLNVDFSSGEARDQGTIASCASHSFIGMLETQLATERGVLIDLSERYQLYANFMASGNMGTDPEVIATFPEIVEAFGVMPEAAYPYAPVLENAHRFSQDLAQGIEGDDAVTIDASVAETRANTFARFEVLTSEDALGLLPEVGGYPVILPARAELLEGAVVPEVEVRVEDGSFHLLPCFTEDEPAVTFAVTPREFLGACFGHEPADFFACQADQPSLVEEKDDCSTLSGFVDAWEDTLVERMTSLATVLHTLDQRQSVFIGVDTPLQLESKAAPLWHTSTYLGSGHAVTAVGYLTAEQLGDPSEQAVGLLEPPSMFDAFAEQTEPGYAVRLEEALVSGDARRIAETRAESVLGEHVTDEGGLILFRNSWGSQLGDMPIGVDGFQSMTFAYFLARVMIVESRDALGLAACGVDFGFDDPFFDTFDTQARDVAWNTVKAQVLTGITTSGGDAREARDVFERCRAEE